MHRSHAARLALLGLLTLLVPVALVLFIVWCVYRRTRYKRVVKDLRLNGTRRPGEVDDVDMGAAVRGGDWLNNDVAVPGTAGLGAHRARFSIFQASMASGDPLDVAFDPIGQQAADAQQRRLARRVAVAAAEAAGNGGGGDSAIAFGDEGTAEESEGWFSDGEGDAHNYPGNEDVTDGGGITGAGPSAPIYASSLGVPATGATGAGASLYPGASGIAGPGTSGPSPLAHSSQYFNETARVLLDRYTAESGGAGPQVLPLASLDGSVADPSKLRRAAGGEGAGSSSGGKTVVKSSHLAFEQILSSAAAPLQVGSEFRHRGDSDSGSGVVGASRGPKAILALTARDGLDAESHLEEDESGCLVDEEEPVFQHDEEFDEEYYEEDDDGN